MNATLLLGSVPSGVYDDLADGAGQPAGGWGVVIFGLLLLGVAVAAGWGAMEGVQARRRAARRRGQP